VWLHNEMLQVEGKKMSKSLGNFFTVRELLDQGHTGDVIRFVFLSTHYRKPMDWTAQKAAEAAKVLHSWRALTEGAAPGVVDDKVLAAMADDLNTAGAIARLHELAKAKDGAALLASAQFLGLLEQSVEAVDLSSYADALFTLRVKAMEDKDFSAVDAFKNSLLAAGIEVKMAKDGVTLTPGPAFDAAKLP